MRHLFAILVPLFFAILPTPLLGFWCERVGPTPTDRKGVEAEPYADEEYTHDRRCPDRVREIESDWVFRLTEETVRSSPILDCEYERKETTARRTPLVYRLYCDVGIPEKEVGNLRHHIW